MTNETITGKTASLIKLVDYLKKHPTTNLDERIIYLLEQTIQNGGLLSQADFIMAILINGREITPELERTLEKIAEATIEAMDIIEKEYAPDYAEIKDNE